MGRVAVAYKWMKANKEQQVYLLPFAPTCQVSLVISFDFVPATSEIRLIASGKCPILADSGESDRAGRSVSNIDVVCLLEDSVLLLVVR